MLNTFWETKDGDLLIVESISNSLENEDQRVCVLTNGDSRFTYAESKLQEIMENEDGDGTLKRVDPKAHGFEFHAILSDRDNERTAHLYQTLLLNCLAITSRRIVPFEETSSKGNVKEHTTILSDGIGFWRHAYPTLDHNEDDPEQLVIRVVLTGEIFTDRCRDPELMMEEQGINSVYRVMPAMRKVDKAMDAAGTIVNNIDFDLQPMVEEIEEASDEDYSLKS